MVTSMYSKSPSGSSQIALAACARWQRRIQIDHPWGNFLSRERAELARWLAAAVGLGTVCWLSSQVPVFRAVARAGVKLERPQH
jgi:hypothetical protein